MNVFILDVNISVEKFVLLKVDILISFCENYICDYILLYVCNKMMHSHGSDCSGRIFTIVYKKLYFERSFI
jgi:hypothetical protein